MTATLTPQSVVLVPNSRSQCTYLVPHTWFNFVATVFAKKDGDGRAAKLLNEFIVAARSVIRGRTRRPTPGVRVQAKELDS